MAPFGTTAPSARARLRWATLLFMSICAVRQASSLVSSTARGGVIITCVFSLHVFLLFLPLPPVPLPRGCGNVARRWQCNTQRRRPRLQRPTPQLRFQLAEWVRPVLVSNWMASLRLPSAAAVRKAVHTL
ncbi:unnamed protein product [Prorocentrum cordatum]|uniref:Secreted protein n=1 Tax=Prorocentrum cordatum TaxID=2364126 RepID=A0ABN9U4K9_9DINO|nr:unnamed protein product [Polarella glacialis]